MPDGIRPVADTSVRGEPFTAVTPAHQRDNTEAKHL
jgi:hypothetical protein